MAPTLMMRSPLGLAVYNNAFSLSHSLSLSLAHAHVLPLRIRAEQFGGAIVDILDALPILRKSTFWFA